MTSIAVAQGPLSLPQLPLHRVPPLLREPLTYAGVLAAATVAVVALRHPVTHWIGTAGDPTTAAAPAATAPAVPQHPALTVPKVGALVVPTHAPRDPFRALVDAQGHALAPVTLAGAALTPGSLAVPTPPLTAVGPAPKAPAVAAPVAPERKHTVAPGESLWSIAATLAGPGASTAQIEAGWHRLWDANRAAVGDNPSVLQVGTVLVLV